MARSRARIKGRSDKGTFVQLPHAVLRSPKYATLSPKAIKLLIDLFSQHNGRNNGDFTMAMSLMAKKGWRSKSTLYAARDELLAAGFIERTRQGGRHHCSLYAVTWLPIDYCGGKLDVDSTRVASGTWKDTPKIRISGPNSELSGSIYGAD